MPSARNHSEYNGSLAWLGMPASIGCAPLSLGEVGQNNWSQQERCLDEVALTREILGMNRFFSKLDLRDIKIDPSGMRFPPDADEVELREEPTAEMADIQEAVTGDHMTRSESTLLTGAERTSPAGAEPAQRNGEVLKVSARSRPSAVAGAIAGVVRELGRAEVQAIGAGATNQAIKAVAIARDYLRETGIEAVCLPAFIDVTIDNEDRTAIRLIVEPR